MGKIEQYEEEFKRQIVKHVLQTGKAVAQVARELGISVNTLHGWVKEIQTRAQGDTATNVPF